MNVVPHSKYFCSVLNILLLVKMKDDNNVYMMMRWSKLLRTVCNLNFMNYCDQFVLLKHVTFFIYSLNLPPLWQPFACFLYIWICFNFVCSFILFSRFYSQGDVEYTIGNTVNNVVITICGARWVLGLSGGSLCKYLIV